MVRAARAADLEAGKHDVVARVRAPACFRWCSTRPPVAMPLAEMMTLGQRERVSRCDCCTLATMRHAVGQRGGLARRDAQQPAVALVQLGGGGGHRAVEVDRHVFRDLAGRLQALQHQQQRLRTAHRERRQQHAAAARDRGADDLPQRACTSSWGAAVAVGRLDSSTSACVSGCGGGISRSSLRPRSPENQRRPPARSVTAQAPSRWPHRREVDARTSPMRERCGRRQHLDACDGALGVGHGVQRQRRRVARPAAAVGAPGVLFLQVGAVEQQHLGQVARCPAKRTTGPLKPCFTSTGSQPQWSRWAWLSTTASISAGATPSGAQLRSRSVL
jgi:hypothetical protein